MFLASWSRSRLKKSGAAAGAAKNMRLVKKKIRSRGRLENKSGAANKLPGSSALHYYMELEETYKGSVF